MSKSWENAGGEKDRSHSHTFFFLSSSPLLRLPARSPFSREKDLSRSRKNVYRKRKNTGGYTQHAKRKRHCNGKHKTTINHSVGSKRFRPVSEQSTRSESQIRRKKWRTFSALVPFFPRPKLRNQTKKAGYAGYINQGM